MRMRRAHQLHVEQSGKILGGEVQGVPGLAGDDREPGRGRGIVSELAGTRPGLALAADPGSRPRGVIRL